jgi:hypothetical protein
VLHGDDPPEVPKVSGEQQECRGTPAGGVCQAQGVLSAIAIGESAYDGNAHDVLTIHRADGNGVGGERFENLITARECQSLVVPDCFFLIFLLP